MQNTYIIKHKSSGNKTHIPIRVYADITSFIININSDKINTRCYIPKIYFKPFYIEPYNPIEKSTR